MRKNYRKAVTLPKRTYRINERIANTNEVRLIDENGDHQGVCSFAEALVRAKEQELDLVEIEPTAKPPVCRIIDFGRLKYSEEKELRKQKAHQKKTEVKGIRLSLRIGAHDLDIRLKHAKKFLEQNDKVKLEMVLRGRERQHGELAKGIIANFIDTLKKDHGLPVSQEGSLSFQGGRISTIIGLKK